MFSLLSYIITILVTIIIVTFWAIATILCLPIGIILRLIQKIKNKFIK